MKKMKSVATIILFLFSISLLAQKSIEGIIKDSETEKPIPYVNIGIVKKANNQTSTGNYEIGRSCGYKKKAEREDFRE